MIRNLLGVYLRDVARKRMRVVWEIHAVGLARELIPLAGENALAAAGFESQSHAADTSEEVYEGEPDSVIIKA